jgi:DNA replication protein DnaC
MADSTSQRETSGRSTTSTERSLPKQQTKTEIDAEWNERLKTEAAERRKQAWIIYLGGPRPYEHYRFETYDPTLNDTHRSLKICQDFNPKQGNLMMLGPVGTGKTHLTTAIAYRILAAGGKARVFDKPGLWEYYKEHGMEPLIELDGLSIQDIELEPNTSRVVEFLARLFEARLNWNRPGATITTNKPIEDLHQILGSKTADRIDGMFQILVIPPETKSVRGHLKRSRKTEP